MSIHHVSRTEDFTLADMLTRIRRLSPLGSVIITDYPENYLLSRYLRRYTEEPVRFILGVSAAAKTMHEAFYQHLPGTLLEGVGRLLATNVKLYVAPMPRKDFNTAVGDLRDALTVRASAGNWVTLDDLIPSAPNSHLIDYLRASGRIVALEPAS
jgi:hypothetical protein